MVRERASNHGIALAWTSTRTSTLIEADERKVKQVVFNLLSNAVKFTPDGGQVDVTARHRDGGVEVAVRDTGIGIAPEEQAQVFEEFRQAAQRRSAARGHRARAGAGQAVRRAARRADPAGERGRRSAAPSPSPCRMPYPPR